MTISESPNVEKNKVGILQVESTTRDLDSSVSSEKTGEQEHYEVGDLVFLLPDFLQGEVLYCGPFKDVPTISGMTLRISENLSEDTDSLQTVVLVRHVIHRETIDEVEILGGKDINTTVLLLVPCNEVTQR